MFIQHVIRKLYKVQNTFWVYQNLLLYFVSALKG